MQKLTCFLFIMVFICNAKIYEDIKNGFSIDIPKDWQLIESKNENVILKCATLPKLQLNANFNVTKSKIPETLSLDDFYHSITEAQERILILLQEDLLIHNSIFLGLPRTFPFALAWFKPLLTR